jgi:hypothetical protein
VQQRRHQRDPAAAAHQEDAGDAGRGQLRRRDRGPRRVDGGVQDRAGQLFELVAAERRVLVGQRNVDHGCGCPGQHLLRGAYVLPQQAVRPPLGRGRRTLQPPPQRGVARRVHGAEVADDRRVDVEAATLGQPLGGEHLEAVLDAAHHRRVERAGAQVVDHERAARPHSRVAEPDEHARGRDRFGHQRDRAQPGALRRGHEDAAPGLRPGRRVRDGRRADVPTGDPARLDGDPPEHGGDQLDDADLDVAEQHPRLVDAPLRVRLEPLRADPRRVYGVAADQQPATGFGVDRRRKSRRPVEEKRPHRAARPRQHRHGVRGTEVDPESVTSRIHSANIRTVGGSSIG